MADLVRLDAPAVRVLAAIRSAGGRPVLVGGCVRDALKGEPVPEPRPPANDFERWIAGSRIPPDKRTPDELCDGIAAAVASRDFRAVNALMTVLALADPGKARTVLDMITAVIDGDERRAVLLAVLGD